MGINMDAKATQVPSLIESCRFLSDPALDGRYPGSPGHETARVSLTDALKTLGFDPLFEGTYSQLIVHEDEVIGSNLGGIWRDTSDRTILLGAHYDHFQGIPGADDNAAALSILIETCRQLMPWNGEHSVVLCFFDLEEPPYFLSVKMGSVYFAANSPVDFRAVDCAIILDLCGHDLPIPGCEDVVFLLGAESSRDLISVVQELRSPAIPICMFDNARIGDMSDHHAFRLRKVPYMFFSCGQWEHYHRPSDTFEKLNLGKMQRLADYLASLIRSLDGKKLAWDPVPEFWRIEAASLRRLTGLPLPETEEFVGSAIQQLVGQFKV